MPTLSRDHRRLLEKTVAQARVIAEEGSHKVLANQYAVHHHEPWPHMTAIDRELRNQLRAHGRQLGDRRDPKRETQEIKHLIQACAYEHWHRMLFSRFLAENDLLLDAQHGVTMTLDDVRELAREHGRDWIDVAAGLAQRMLLAVFRPDDPVLKVELPPETRQRLEQKLASLPKEIFQAGDSLGWVYQFWQREEKDRVNKSEVKIGADELAAVTQIFTEDYMVLFLVENTLGAWWVAKRRAEGNDVTLPGYQWTYLRLNEDGSPAAGTFDGWPRAARDLRLVDPCMGSGHFLTVALPVLARMRMEEDRLSLQDAIRSVLRENLFGLELDARCSQIAAFNLAITSWRMAGEYFLLPTMNLACSGLGINAKEDDWLKLAGEDDRVRETMRCLYDLFQKAPLLGSLIDPKRDSASLLSADFQIVGPLLERALAAEQVDDNARELAVTAQGLFQAARILTETFTLVLTNVPYLSNRKQCAELKNFCTSNYGDAKNDLGVTFLLRLIQLCGTGGTLALVMSQYWLFKSSYAEVRRDLLESMQWPILAKLGVGAFEEVSGEVVNVAAGVWNRSRATEDSTIAGLDVTSFAGPAAKARALQTESLFRLNQVEQRGNAKSRIVFGDTSQLPTLDRLAIAPQGTKTGDDDRWRMCIWEIDSLNDRWLPYLTTVRNHCPYGGRHLVLDWKGRGAGMVRPRIKNRALGKCGVAISQSGDLPATLYMGERFDSNIAPLVPTDPAIIPALWAYCTSIDYLKNVRLIDQSMKVTNVPLLQVPFDLAHWQGVAREKYPNGIPKPHSDDPTQWLFSGHPKGSHHPLQVAVARLLAYQWPRQADSSFPDCPPLGPDGLERHADSGGIVSLNAIAGEASAADHLRELLTDAYGNEWSAAKLKELLGEWDSLEDWLRDGFFEEHCRVFNQRPFVWHIWDGRKDGFHALVNYHKLAAPNGEGRKTLEKLIYTYIGRWIDRQRDEIRGGKEGADARLTAATHLKTELENIVKGETPYDIFVRWKTLDEQPLGWEPDINDGVRLNIRPWLTAKPHQPSRRDTCVLRVTPKIPYGKDRGKEPHRKKEDYPWFWSWDERSDDFVGGKDFDGSRWNELHYSLDKKKEVRGLKQGAEATR